MATRQASLGGSLAAGVERDASQGSATLRRNERRAWLVAAVSVAVMILELTAGGRLNSLALQSDGLHSGTHAAVLLVAAVAYALARRRASSPERMAHTLNLAALVNGVLLCAAGVWLAIEAVLRLVSPEPVRFVEAAVVNTIGLAVGGVSAVLLRDAHGRRHSGGPGPHAQGHDLNLWAAYLHMLADVVTSVLAVAALLLGALTGWTQLDAIVGFLNAAVVAVFAAQLLRATVAALITER